MSTTRWRPTARRVYHEVAANRAAAAAGLCSRRRPGVVRAIVWTGLNRNAVARLTGMAVPPDGVEFRLPDGSGVPREVMAGDYIVCAGDGVYALPAAAFQRDFEWADAPSDLALLGIPTGS